MYTFLFLLHISMYTLNITIKLIKKRDRWVNVHQMKQVSKVIKLTSKEKTETNELMYTKLNKLK
jgi:hypothetical protein